MIVGMVQGPLRLRSVLRVGIAVMGGCGKEIGGMETDRMDCVCCGDMWQMEFVGIKCVSSVLGAELAISMDDLRRRVAHAAVFRVPGWHGEGLGARANPRIVES